MMLQYPLFLSSGLKIKNKIFYIITREYSKLDKSIKQHFLKCHASTLNVKDKKSTFTQGTKGIAETQL